MEGKTKMTQCDRILRHLEGSRRIFAGLHGAGRKRLVDDLPVNFA